MNNIDNLSKTKFVAPHLDKRANHDADAVEQETEMSYLHFLSLALYRKGLGGCPSALSKDVEVC